MLNERETHEVKDLLERCTFVKAADICEHVKQTYGKVYTVAGMTAWLHRNGFSYKKPKGAPAKADLEEQKKFVQEYQELKDNLPDDEPIEFCDATHPTMATKIGHGWIKTGTDRLIKTTASRTRVNVIGSINLKTMKLTATFHKTIDSDAMEILFNKLKKKYSDAPKIHLILDQGPYNISEQTRRAAEAKSIKLHHLPTYSPNLNPIERVWKVQNEFVRNNRFFASAKQFREEIETFFNTTWDLIADSMRSRVNDNFQIIESAL